MSDRAVCYSRVSTSDEAQLNAIESQIQENKQAVLSKGWVLIDEYIDEGKSGTQVKHRDEYQRLYEDMLTDKFDIICIKDQDRLMRNTKDWYLFIDRLVITGKRLYMYLENSWYTPDNSLITGIKAIMAEEFSRNLSKKINNSRNCRLEKAKSGEDFTIIDNGLSLVYKHDKQKGYYIANAEGAEAVKEIFALCLQGYGARNISRIIKDKYPNLRNKKGNPLEQGSIIKILRDERYKGILAMNKTHRDFETKKTIHYPKSEWVYRDGLVPAIVSVEDWEKAQEAITGRTLSDPENHRGQNKGKYLLSSKIFCGECGGKYYRRSNADGVVWSCSTYCNHGRKTQKQKNPKDLGLRDLSKGCDSSCISQREIMEIIEAIGNEFTVNRKQVKADMLSWLTSLLATVTNSKELERVEIELAKAEKKSSKLLDSLLAEIIPPEAYRKKAVELDQAIGNLQERQKLLSNQSKDAKEIRRVIDNLDAEIEEYIKGAGVEEKKLKFVLDNLLKITVFEDKLMVDIQFMKRPIGVRRGLPYVDCTLPKRDIGIP